MTTYQSGSVKIWWDNAIGAYKMVTPYNATFVDLLKQLAPGSDRVWDPSSKVWTISEKIVHLVKDLAEKSFKCQATFISRQQAQSASAPPKTVTLASIDSLMLEFFKLLPYNAARKAYQVAAMELHPDRGGSLENMTKLNATWSRIEKEHYGQ